MRKVSGRQRELKNTASGTWFSSPGPPGGKADTAAVLCNPLLCASEAVAAGAMCERRAELLIMTGGPRLNPKTTPEKGGEGGTELTPDCSKILLTAPTAGQTFRNALENKSPYRLRRGCACVGGQIRQDRPKLTNVSRTSAKCWSQDDRRIIIEHRRRNYHPPQSVSKANRTISRTLTTKTLPFLWSRTFLPACATSVRPRHRERSCVLGSGAFLLAREVW